MFYRFLNMSADNETEKYVKFRANTRPSYKIKLTYSKISV